MKKIYLSFAIIASAIQINAQSARSADQIEGLTLTQSPVDLSAVKIQKNSLPVLATLPCDTMKTTSAGGNSQNGNMFDVVNTNSITATITNIDQCFDFSTGTDTIMVYYKTGTFVGSEANPGAWTFAGKAAVSPTVAGSPLPVALPLNINIPTTGTVGLYVTLKGNNVAYTNGLTMGAVFSSKDGINFKEGKGVTYPFGSTFPGTGTASRVWNGVLHYCVGATGINESELNNQLSVFPNPASDNITVRSSNGNFENATIMLADMTGRVVNITTNVNQEEIILNLSGFEKGIYLLQIKDENGVKATKKIMVK